MAIYSILVACKLCKVKICMNFLGNETTVSACGLEDHILDAEVTDETKVFV